ncbi:hypothetical protein WJX73_008673 [Symbiochloris irregularis]|uniref:Uncharacterized protein n=1 Tax=Symbiochloris irregularis TaxID=706552 RepID=A0AAW1PC19_9CHLO
METAESLASTLYWRQRLKFAHSDQQHLLGAQPLQTEAGQILHWGALRTYGFTPEPATAVTAKAAGRASSKAPDKAVGSDNRQRNAKATKPAKRKSVSARAVATTVSISPEGTKSCRCHCHHAASVRATPSRMHVVYPRGGSSPRE